MKSSNIYTRNQFSTAAFIPLGIKQIRKEEEKTGYQNISRPVVLPATQLNVSAPIPQDDVNRFSNQIDSVGKAYANVTNTNAKYNASCSLPKTAEKVDSLKKVIEEELVAYKQLDQDITEAGSIITKKVKEKEKEIQKSLYEIQFLREMFIGNTQWVKSNSLLKIHTLYGVPHRIFEMQTDLDARCSNLSIPPKDIKAYLNRNDDKKPDETLRNIRQLNASLVMHKEYTTTVNEAVKQTQNRDIALSQYIEQKAKLDHYGLDIEKLTIQKNKEASALERKIKVEQVDNSILLNDLNLELNEINTRWAKIQLRYQEITLLLQNRKDLFKFSEKQINDGPLEGLYSDNNFNAFTKFIRTVVGLKEQIKLESQWTKDAKIDIQKSILANSYDLFEKEIKSKKPRIDEEFDLFIKKSECQINKQRELINDLTATKETIEFYLSKIKSELELRKKWDLSMPVTSAKADVPMPVVASQAMPTSPVSMTPSGVLRSIFWGNVTSSSEKKE